MNSHSKLAKNPIAVGIFNLLLFFCPILLAKPIELTLWHSMAGSLGREVRWLSDSFNQQQKQYRIKPIYKGDYLETLTSFAAAFRAHQAPDLVQIFEVGTAIMLSPKGVIKPLHTLMQEQNIPLPQEDFIPSVREFYSQDGKLMAMPFNLSTPILYYNKDLLSDLGYTNFPSTWEGLEALAKKIKQAGYSCAYTTSYPGWILFESFLALHHLPLAQGNPVRAVFNTEELLRHFQRLERWHQSGYFRYGGRGDEATVLFSSGICPLFSQSSGAYTSLLALVPFHLGIALMPLDTQASRTRHANTTGGAALWAVAGHKAEQYKGIAQFFAFLAKAQIQQHWHAHTGYLPLGFKGIYAPLLLSPKNPVLLLAQRDLETLLPSYNQKSRVPQNQIRHIHDEVLEAMLTHSMDPKEALQRAVLLSNKVLKRFLKNTS